MFKLEDAIKMANKLAINFEKFTIYDFLTGMNIELEHGKINPETNVTDDDIIMTSKIALAHLNEYNNYYNEEYGLPAFEKYLKNRN